MMHLQSSIKIIIPFLLLKNMFGSYRIDKNAEHLNDVHKQI